jgi:hypothetical protein
MMLVIMSSGVSILTCVREWVHAFRWGPDLTPPQENMHASKDFDTYCTAYLLSESPSDNGVTGIVLFPYLSHCCYSIGDWYGISDCL